MPGFENGFVTHLEKAADSLQKILFQLFPAGKHEDLSIFVVLGNAKLKTHTFSSSQYYQGLERTISPYEIRSVVSQTRSIATLPLTEFVLQAVPESFLVNDLANIRNPLGLDAHRLGVTLKIFTMNFQDFKNISRAFEAAEIEPKEYFPRTLTISETVLTEQEKDQGGLAIDIAETYTELTLWRSGFLSASRILPLGARSLSEKIAGAWGIEIHDAARIRELYSSFEAESKFGEELIPLIERNGKGNYSVCRREFQQKFLAQAKEWMAALLQGVDVFIRDERFHYPPLVFAGETTRVDGFLEFLQAQFSREGRLGIPRRLEVPGEWLMNPLLAPALGAFRWLSTEEREHKPLVAKTGIFEKTFASARDWFSSYF